MPHSGRRKIIKFLYFLSIIRWYNVTLVVLGQYLLSVFVFGDKHPGFSIVGVLKDSTLHFMAVASLFTVCGAFIINAFYDSDKDLVNKPLSSVYGQVIGNTFLANSYIIVNLLALIFAFFATIKILIFFAFYQFLCWFYSHKLQKMPVLREVSSVLLTIAPLLAVWLHFGQWDWGLLYYFGALCALLITKDVVKEINGHKGNLIFGYNTVVVVAGKSNASRVILWMNLAAVSLFALAYSWQKNPHNWLVEIAEFSVIGSLAVSVLAIDNSPKRYKIMDALLKLLILLHMMLIVGSFVYRHLPL